MKPNRSHAAVGAAGVAIGALTAFAFGRIPPTPPVAPPAPAPASQVITLPPIGPPPYALGVLPDPKRTPGWANPDVTPATLATTIAVSGWTKTIRPPASYTTALKRKQLASGYAVGGDMNLSDYEEDHETPLELGGHPTDERNLWPALWHLNSSGYDLGMKTKDRLETRLRDLVVSGKMALGDAQHEIQTDWPASYRKHVGEWPRYVAAQH